MTALAPSHQAPAFPQFKTIAEQRIEWLDEQRLIRKLTDAEWIDYRKAEHAIYERQRRRERR